MLEVNNLKKSFDHPKRIFDKEKRKVVIENITFQLFEGDCLGIVGESGSGKSTLARILLGLENYDEGSVLIDGVPAGKWLKQYRGGMGVVFQDYRTSVNPNWIIKQIMEEPLHLVGKKTVENDLLIIEMLEKVQLSSNCLKKYPHELSGGQLQRICIARALLTKPKYLILDEAISSLDISIQTQILDLLTQLQKDLNLTYLFIAHDLMAVSGVCNRVAFLNKGRIIEEIECKHLNCAKSAYAKSLLESVIEFKSHYRRGDEFGKV